MLSTILVPLDGSALAERALPYAAAIARPLSCRVILLRATNVTRSESPPESTVESVAARLRASGVRSEPRLREVTSDDMAQAIADTARESDTELIVMSTHGRSGLGRWVYGSVADAVLHKSEVPLLLVGAACEDHWPVDRRPRLVVALDGSQLAEEVLAPALELAEALQGSLVLLEVVHRQHYEYGDLSPERDVETARQYLEQVRGRIRTTRQIEVVAHDVGPESPARALASYAEREDIDLIAMATHGRGGVARLALGSVATGVVQRCTVPVLLVRPLSMRLPPTRVALAT